MQSFLAGCRHWVFDMDGTLTLAVHDFPAIRRHLGVPDGHDILAHLDSLPAAQAHAGHAWLDAHEFEMAALAQPAPGALALIRTLHARGCRLGILTRNLHAVALHTLDAIGLGDCFASADILGRGEAIPKPAPDGLQRLARHWGVSNGRLLMVGDYLHDLQCARAAGTRSVLVHRENLWPQWADWHVRDCSELLEVLQAEGS